MCEELLTSDPLIILWRKVVYHAFQNVGGMKTSELIVFTLGATEGGIPSKSKADIRLIMEYAGFEMIKKYRHASRKTERVWCLKEEFKHKTLEELMERYENKLIDYTALKDLI